MSRSRRAELAREREAELDDEAFGEMAAIDGRQTEHGDEDDVDDLADDDADDEADVVAEAPPRPRTGAKRTVLHAIRQIPAYLRLLVGLIRDSRVSRFDKFLVLAAAAYIVSPLDFIPDVIPFFGEVDDIFLLMLALQRLVEHTGRRVLADHWHGDPHELSDLNLAGMVSAAGFFLPPALRRRLRRMARK